MSNSRYFIILFIVLSSFQGLVQCRLKDKDYELAVISVQNRTDESDICMIHVSDFGQIAATANSSVKHEISTVRGWTGCGLLKNKTEAEDVQGKIVLLSAGNCTLSARAKYVSEMGAVAFFLEMWDMTDIVKGNDTEGENVTAGLVRTDNFAILKEMGANAEAWIYELSMDKSFVEPESILMLCIAVFTVTFGACWSGISRHRDERLRTETSSGPKNGSRSLQGNYMTAMQNARPGFSVGYVIGIVILMSCMLVALYFFYQYLVYGLLASFVVGSMVSLYMNLTPLMQLIPIRVTIPVRSYNMDLRNVVLFVLCLTTIIVWMVFRKNFEDIWLLQNALCLSFVIFAIRFLRLPNLKIILILSLLLFIYDCFFVFVTPYIISMFPIATSSNSEVDGESIMVSVAKNAIHGDEPLPIAIVIPRLFPHKNVCGAREFALLGSGDMAVPGMVIAYFQMYDLRKQGSLRLYFPTAIVGYTIGLILAHVALSMSQSAQPALFYIVPLILIPLMTMAAIRGDFKNMWNDDVIPKPVDKQEQEPESVETAVESNGYTVSGSSSNTSNLAENSNLISEHTRAP